MTTQISPNHERRRRNPRRPRTIALATLAALALMGAATACSSSTQTTSKSSTAASTAAGANSANATSSAGDSSPSSAPASNAAVPSYIPAAVKDQYTGYQYFSKLQHNPLPNYKAPAGKLSMCYSTTYLGNEFQSGVVSELQKLNDQYVAAGVAQGKLTVTNANNSASQQLQQLNTLIQNKCSVIFSFPASPTALCATVANAVKQGLLFVTIESPVYCPDAINVTWNGYLPEYQGAVAVAKAMGGKGNIVVTKGIPGVAISTAEDYAVKDALKAYPDIKLLGNINGMYTPSIAATQMASFLATHPQKVDGIVDAGAEDVATEQALVKAGRPVAKINSITGENGILAFWKKYPESMALGFNQSPQAAAYEAMYVVAQMLAGNKPVVGTLFYPVPQITTANFSQWYKPTMTINDNGIPQSPGGKAVADSYFAPLFTGGKALKFTPKP